MKDAKHTKDEKGICWKTRTVKGDLAQVLCGRASYESVVRCDEHSPLLPKKKRKCPNPAPDVVAKASGGENNARV